MRPLFFFAAPFVLHFFSLSFARGNELSAADGALAARYSFNHGGRTLLVQQHGRVLLEEYAHGFSRSTPHKIYSGTKSFVAVAALIAADDGLLRLNEPASATLHEWRHDSRSTITIDQLLSHTSGLDSGGGIIYPARDQFAAALRVPLISPPGSRFHYGPVGYQAFGEILRRKLRPSGQTVEGYLRRRLFAPLHIHIADWKHDDAGNPLLHAGLQLTTREWARFGQFVLTAAENSSQQSLLHQSISHLFAAHDANPAYGLGFWLNAPPPDDSPQPITDLQIAIDGDQLYPDGPDDLVAALGSDKQRLYVIPSLDLVIVRFGEEAPFSDGDFLSRLITGMPHPDRHTH